MCRVYEIFHILNCECEITPQREWLHSSVGESVAPVSPGQVFKQLACQLACQLWNKWTCQGENLTSSSVQ